MSISAVVLTKKNGYPLDITSRYMDPFFHLAQAIYVVTMFVCIATTLYKYP